MKNSTARLQSILSLSSEPLLLTLSNLSLENLDYYLLDMISEHCQLSIEQYELLLNTKNPELFESIQNRTDDISLHILFLKDIKLLIQFTKEANYEKYNI